MDGDEGLPDTRDPFELLGVTPEADERALKRAYAKLIKRYRPDRDPEMFARIHAAFEAAQFIRARVAPLPDPDAPENQPVGEIRLGGAFRDTPDVGALRRHVVETLAGEDASALDGAVSRALDAPAPLDVIFGGHDEAALARLLRSSAITWSRLAASADHDTAAVLLVAIVEAHLAADEVDRAVSVLRDERLFDDAMRSIPVAESALRTIAAIGWRTSDGAGLFERFRALPPVHGLDRALDRTVIELEAAAAMRRAAITLPPPLAAYLREDPIATVPRGTELADALAASLLDETETYLALYDKMSEPTMKALDDRFALDVGGECEALERLPRQVFAHLTREVRLVRTNGDSRLRIAAPILVLLTFFAFAISATAGKVIGAVLVIGGLAVWIDSQKRGYPLRRRDAAVILARVGVPSWLLHRWIIVNANLAGPLGNYEPAIAKDRGLRMLGLTANLVRHVRPSWKQAYEGEGDEA